MFVGDSIKEEPEIWKKIQEIKEWIPHRRYLKKIGVEFADYPEELRFQILIKELEVETRLQK